VNGYLAEKMIKRDVRVPGGTPTRISIHEVDRSFGLTLEGDVLGASFDSSVFLGWKARGTRLQLWSLSV
jgi:hypothetical protein